MSKGGAQHNDVAEREGASLRRCRSRPAVLFSDIWSIERFAGSRVFFIPEKAPPTQLAGTSPEAAEAVALSHGIRLVYVFNMILLNLWNGNSFVVYVK
uniref:Uncharacterized protein n=1 Tax=Physcomitrium patens TaxID=3218 RepID=A0A2K1J4W3_PHYPA|nr:hypothetical protein PHYPA_022417 [Physcomitrium patens]PNR36569.1 hypothetical protein PHYPA_022420 [Physcomitrium patens]